MVGIFLARARLFGAALAAVGLLAATPADAAENRAGIHEGVASCSGSTCHSRLVAGGGTVRQNELATWQDRSSPTGSHSRAWRALSAPLASAIAKRLGLARAEEAPDCLGCHTDAVAAARRGTYFQISDGVGCESCHGGSGGWLARHTLVDATHAGNVSLGMSALDDPKTRAALCLDCHFGGTKPGQFLTHRMMAAGHPRLSFELDLFSALQRHHDVDADYAKRKQVAGGMKMWAVGQALALERALTLYSADAYGQDGAFPQFYFFDCQSCHRPIPGDLNPKLTAEPNPARPIPVGQPPFDDQNIIMLSTVVKVSAPALAERFEADSRGFHAALARGRGVAIATANALAASSRALADAFAAHDFARAETFAVLEAILNGAIARYTDYAGGAQAVMAADTLLDSLVADSAVERRNVEALRPDISRLYAILRDANDFHPMEFRGAMQRVAVAVGKLR